MHTSCLGMLVSRRLYETEETTLIQEGQSSDPLAWGCLGQAKSLLSLSPLTIKDAELFSLELWADLWAVLQLAGDWSWWHDSPSLCSKPRPFNIWPSCTVRKKIAFSLNCGLCFDHDLLLCLPVLWSHPMRWKSFEPSLILATHNQVALRKAGGVRK